MDNNIGSRIRAMRKQKKMTLEQVSLKSNLSISFLSQVELAKSSVTLTSLRKIAEALNVTITHFFEEDNDHKQMKKKSAQKEQSYADTKFTLTNLTGDIENPLVEPMIATLLPGDKSKEPYAHNGEEFLYLLEGILTVILDDEEFFMHPGDSLHIKSLTPHVWFNDDTEPAKLLIINTKNPNCKEQISEKYRSLGL